MSKVDARATSGTALAVVVPCRDEALVIARKLWNLARVRWPVCTRAHELLVVDDGSSDATWEIAQRVAADAFGTRADVRCRVLRNTHAAGKAGAVRTGLDAAPTDVRLCVLSDADVVLEDSALEELARAFEARPELALACGAQRFVRDLADDGTCRAADLGPLRDAASVFDRVTARVRALESRAGLCFSVHGQLLAWRSALALAPRSGIAADDLDLLLQVRARTEPPTCVEIVRTARFVEQKTARGERSGAQEERRARAYFQALWASRAPRRGLAARAQWLFYRYVPGMAPLLSWLAFVASIAGAYVAFGALWAAAVAGVVLCAAWRGPLRGWTSLMRVIARAQRAEGREQSLDRWEMSRT